MLTYAQHCRDKTKELNENMHAIDADNEEDNNDHDDGDGDDHREASQALRMRGLALLRIAGTCSIHNIMSFDMSMCMCEIPAIPFHEGDAEVTLIV